jgi:hypothetical protein
MMMPLLTIVPVLLHYKKWNFCSLLNRLYMYVQPHMSHICNLQRLAVYEKCGVYVHFDSKKYDYIVENVFFWEPGWAVGFEGEPFNVYFLFVTVTICKPCLCYSVAFCSDRDIFLSHF